MQQKYKSKDLAIGSLSSAENKLRMLGITNYNIVTFSTDYNEKDSDDAFFVEFYNADDLNKFNT